MAPRGPRRIAAALVPLLLASALPLPADAGPYGCHTCAGIPWAWDDDGEAPPLPPVPYTQGFALTVPVTPGSASSRTPAVLDRYADVAATLSQCWSPRLSADDARWRDLTLRVSFRRDGRINGIPRVVHVSDPADGAVERRARESLLVALSRCTPLSLSPSLGQAIAGQIFAIRFVQQRTG